MGRMRRVSVVALIGLVATAACSKQTDPVPVPSPVSKPTAEETFNGTIQQAGSFQYQFKVSEDGEVYVTLKAETSVAVDADPAADPPVVGKPAVPVTYPLNVRIGQSTLTTLGLQCTNLKQVTTPPSGTPQLTGQALAGTFCVDVSDATATLPEPVTITVTIAHS